MTKICFTVDVVVGLDEVASCDGVTGLVDLLTELAVAGVDEVDYLEDISYVIVGVGDEVNTLVVQVTGKVVQFE